MNQKLLFVQGALFTIIGALTPVIAVLSSDTALTQRTIAVLVISGLVSGATALKAFLSTTFADSPGQVTARRNLTKNQ